MQKMRSILGLPVLETDNGAQIGEAQEVVLDMEQAAVAAIIVSDANWFSEAQGIYFKDVRRVGRDAIMVRGKDVISVLTDLQAQNGVYCAKELFDKQVYTDAGSIIGSLVDILWDEITGELKGYELSDGIIVDLLQGRMFMPVPQAQVVSTDKLIVPEAMAKLLHAEM